MATASKVSLSTADCGEYHVSGITAESAAKASEVLQENHDNHHIFFNRSGFHSTSSLFHDLSPTPQCVTLYFSALVATLFTWIFSEIRMLNVHCEMFSCCQSRGCLL